MKKTGFFFIALFLGIIFNGFSQTAVPTDFFAGKWEITILGTPNGDNKMVTELVRKDGKLTGELKDPTDTTKPAIPITSVEEKNGVIEISFSASGYDITLPLKKEDENTLKGKVMDMFDAKAVRIK
jgi:hypothetical protein